MLSFDVTDRSIRIIRGADVGGRIRIQSSTTVDIPEGLVENGYINDIPQMATIINNGLKEKRMNDKDAVISISSNRIQFKELNVPQVKKAVQFKTMVQNQMQQSMTVMDDQCISYSIAGDFMDGDKALTKVLATACPRDVVDCYRKVFSMLGIALKSVMVSCNCISKIVMSDKKINERMPLLLVQIDPHFININLFENGQLSFTRFTSIYEDDYDDKSDYMFQAVNDNIFRMFQFQKTRSSQQIKNVIFYGDTSEFIRLTNSLEQMNIKAQLLKVPSNLSGYENLEFSLFANAIGAMFYSNINKKKKDGDSVNLLDTDVGTTNQIQVSGSQIGLQIFGAFAISAVVVGAGVGIVKLLDSGVKSDIATIDEYIQSKQEPLAEIDRKNGIIEKLNNYSSMVTSAKNSFETFSVYNSEVNNIITEKLGDVKIKTFSYSNGLLSLTCSAEKYDSPAAFIQRLTELDKFDNITYLGYSSGGDEQGNVGTTTVTEVDPVTGETVTRVVPVAKSGLEFSIELQMRPSSIPSNDVDNPENADNNEGGEE